MRPLLPLLLVVACSPANEPVELDLTAALGPTEARAGVLHDERALFAGVAAEGRPGDVMLVNDRVRFVVQGARDGSYYVQQGGGVIDADIVRTDGDPGRDMVEEWMVMAGLGRLMDAEQVAVVEDGVGSSRARVVAEGPESAMELITGALGSPDLIRDTGMRMRTEYSLRPGSWFLEVETTLTPGDDVDTLLPGAMLMGSSERFELWDPGAGRGAFTGSGRPWTGYVGMRNDGAAAIFAEPGEYVDTGGLALLADLAGLAGGLTEPMQLTAGEPQSFRFYYGVAPDLATLTDAWFDVTGEAHEELAGTVTAPDGNVAGARVHIDVDGSPYTLAVTDADGAFSVRVPAGSAATATAVGRSTGRHGPLAAGSPAYGPYAASTVQQATLDAWDAQVALPVAEGRGVGTPEAPLQLGEPAVLDLDCGGPCAAWLRFAGPRPEVDESLSPGFPGGDAAQGWAGGDGRISMAVEPGDYELLVHRGSRFETHSQSVTLVAGQSTAVSVDLTPAYTHDGWLLGDPHSHAAPSNDAAITMSDRLITSAGSGIQVHFGTDHDNIADYNPIASGVGVDEHLRSVIADEVSSVARGHFNAYPLMLQTDAPNNGAFLWWSETQVTTTQQQMDALRERHGDIVIQSNHPMDSGLANQAGWTPGLVSRAERWTTDIDAVELCNSGNCEDTWDFFVDLVQRGVDVVPVGVSDSHGHTSGHLGMSATFLASPSDEPGSFTDADLLATMRAGEVIVTRGPFIDSSIMPGSRFSELPASSWDVEALSPSWIVVDQLELWGNGELLETVDGSTASFDLVSTGPAWWVVVARGATPMQPVDSRTPFAMTAPVYFDPDGGDWEGVLPPIQVE